MRLCLKIKNKKEVGNVAQWEGSGFNLKCVCIREREHIERTNLKRLSVYPARLLKV